MNWGIGRRMPALVIAAIALFAALGGSVYAAAKIDGSTVKPNSLPGNRVVVGSLPPNRLQEGSIPGKRLAPGSVTGVEVDASTLDQVPSAVHADSADAAQTAGSALSAVNAVNAEKVDGHDASCGPGTRHFAGACSQTVTNEAPASAPIAASVCASRNGELPDALALVAFSQQPGIELAEGDEWTGDVTNVSGLDSYAVVTVSADGKANFVVSTASKRYRCVIPLVS